jgi:acyl carrier protein
MQERLQNVFRLVFADPRLVISRATTARDIKMWDSLTHLELIASIESEFDIRFSFAEVMDFNCVGDMLDAVEHHLKST